MMKEFSSEIKDNEILVDRIFIDDELFIRYYHHNTIPTRYFASKKGKIYSEITDVIMKPGNTTGGYKFVGIKINPKKKPKYIQVHKIIATIFCGGYHKSLVVDHIDGNKKNNSASNLEWVTHSENTLRAYKNNQHKKYFGEDNGSVIYSDEIIHKVCKLLSKGVPTKEVAIITGVRLSKIHSITRGVSRLKISSQYKFPKIYGKKRNPLNINTKEKIKDLYYNKGYSAKDIQKALNIKSMSKIIHAIYDDKYKK